MLAKRVHMSQAMLSLQGQISNSESLVGMVSDKDQQLVPLAQL